MKKILRSLASSTSSDSLASTFRRRRFRRFLELISTMEKRPLTILDVGGRERYWEIQGFIDKGHTLIMLNVNSEETHHPNIASVTGDACDLSRYSDRSIDIVFSNSVIEHLFTRERQQKMADEVRRIGKKYYIQTPSFWFPVEPHFLFPFFHWLPKRIRVFLVRHFALGWYPRLPDRETAERQISEIQLLTRTEMQSLFPDATILTERFFGLTKSYTAVKY